MKQKDSYELLAKVYDIIQCHPEHELWLKDLFAIVDSSCDYYQRQLSILDLGAGTGIFARELALRGQKVLALDISEAMLEKLVDSYQEELEALNIPDKVVKRLRSYLEHLQVDLRQIKEREQEIKNSPATYEGCFDIVICLLDTINHLTAEEVKALFKNLHLFTHKATIFVFDALSLEYIRHHFSEFSYAEHFDDVAFFWDVDFFEDEKRVSHRFKFYENAELEDRDDLYRLVMSELSEYYHSPEFLHAALLDSNWVINEEPKDFGPSDERLVYICMPKLSDEK